MVIKRYYSPAVLFFITFILSEAELKEQMKTSEQSDGIFQAFVKDLLLIIASDEFEPKIKQYLKILQDLFTDMEYEATLKMTNEIQELLQMPDGYIKNKLLNYRQALDRHRPHRTRFLNAMNELFREAQETEFENYLEKVKNWGKILKSPTIGDDETTYIKEQTKKIIYDVIIESVHKYGTMDQVKLVTVLAKAVEEYNDTPDWGLPGRVVHDAEARKKHNYYFQEY